MRHRWRRWENTCISSDSCSLSEIQGIGGGLVLVYTKISIIEACVLFNILEQLFLDAAGEVLYYKYKVKSERNTASLLFLKDY